MADMLRPDGRPFVTDNRSAVPRYVIEDDAEGRVIVMNQFTGEFETVAEKRPYREADARTAFFALRKREMDAYFAREVSSE
jgi:hypothetical protein